MHKPLRHTELKNYSPESNTIPAEPKTWQRADDDIWRRHPSGIYYERPVIKARRLRAQFMAMTGARICEIVGRTCYQPKDDKSHPGFPLPRFAGRQRHHHSRQKA